MNHGLSTMSYYEEDGNMDTVDVTIIDVGVIGFSIASEIGKSDRAVV